MCTKLEENGYLVTYTDTDVSTKLCPQMPTIHFFPMFLPLQSIMVFPRVPQPKDLNEIVEIGRKYGKMKKECVVDAMVALSPKSYAFVSDQGDLVRAYFKTVIEK